MSHTLTLELPDEVYQPLRAEATLRDMDLAEVMLERLRARWRVAPPRKLPEEDQAAALAELMAFSGCVAGNDPHASDNERIDADLARAYADPHREA